MLRKILLTAASALLLAACTGGGGSGGSTGGGAADGASESGVWKPDLRVEVDEPSCAPLRAIAREAVPIGDPVASEDWDDIRDDLVATGNQLGTYDEALSLADTRTLLATIRDVRSYVARSASIAERAEDAAEYVDDLAAHPDTPEALGARLRLDAWTRENCGFSLIEGIDS